MNCPHPEKVPHRSFDAAMAARESLESERGIDIALRPYRCEDHWHLGHKHKPLTFAAWDRKMRRRARRRKR